MNTVLADTSQAANCDHIPVIDLSHIDSPYFEQRQELSRTVYDAYTQVCFFHIRNHGIPESMITRIHDVAAKFFSVADEQKMKFYVGNSKKFHGYSPIGAEQATGTDDHPISEEEAMGVLSENFVIDYGTQMDSQRSEGDPLPPDTYGLYGDNQ
ncbi:hypothetical protein N7532_005652 [Penicillium argentinense]|uniref:Non-haem dioxygenase N-terminal domain-containing protein n=1 Tax=Penicillium argentinense TaxID=1131581 RepID=A0A9W9FEH7_9EURO|nr:uncharacterized protein N7532_005652 [Penicillium argentinense]KAJ5098651.1 hypothetical protein N7532_005652 [Penicillium argentinense]